MKKFFVIGNPISHSLSPELHNFWIKKNKINAVYDKIKLEESELKDFINKLRNEEIHGINVTVPFKNKVIKYLDKLSLSKYLITLFLKGTVTFTPCISSFLNLLIKSFNSESFNLILSYTASILFFLIQKLCNSGERECSIGLPITKNFFIYAPVNSF